MRITKRRLKRIIHEEKRKLREDSISDELDHLRKNMDDDREHIDNLEKDIEDDREEMKHAHEEEKKHESRRFVKNRLRRILRKTINEEHQGYDWREDEHLGQLHGPASDHEQGYSDRRDDAGFEERGEVHHHHHHHHHHHQGYDSREDEHLAAEHGAEAAHEQSYHDRRDDAGFEVRHESRNRKALKRYLSQIIRESF